MVQAWREEVGILPYVRGIAFSGEVIDLGNPIEAVLSHPDPERLAQIADSVVNGLRGIAGVFDVRSDHTPGVREIQLELRPEARTLGLTLEGMAQQTRAAFFGAEALRVQRGREEVKVYVRLPEDERDAITDIEGYLIRTPNGRRNPLEPGGCGEVRHFTTGGAAPGRAACRHRHGGRGQDRDLRRGGQQYPGRFDPGGAVRQKPGTDLPLRGGNSSSNWTPWAPCTGVLRSPC